MRQRGWGSPKPLLEGRLSEVSFGVFQVIVGVHPDKVKVGLGEGAADLGGDTGDQRMGWDLHALRDNSAGGHNGAAADVCSVEHNRAHADKDFVLQGASVDGGVVSDSAHIADDDGVQELHSVQDGAILDVGAGADTDVMDIAADDGVHPHARVVAEDDIADELGGGVDVAGGWNRGSDVAVRADHGSECTNRHKTVYL